MRIALKPLLFTRSMRAWVITGFPHPVSPPGASSELPRFQPNFISATSWAAVLLMPEGSAAIGEVLYDGKIGGSWITVTRLLWSLAKFMVNSTDRLVPEEFSGAVNFIVALPLLPDDWLSCSQLKPVISMVHAALEVNVRGTVPPISGMVSVVLVRVIGEVVVPVLWQLNAIKIEQTRINFFIFALLSYLISTTLILSKAP